MAITRRKNKSGWRALGALILLLTSIFTPSIKSFLPEPVSCGMACCEASGVCYCQSHHTDEGDEDETATQSDTRTASSYKASISQSCPAQCAQVPAGFQKHSIAKAAAPRITFVINTTRQLFISVPHFARDALVAEANSPRAPPALFHL